MAYSTPQTWGSNVADCMRESGVDSAQMRDGTGLTYRGDGPGERIVFYGCSVAYPLDPRAEGYLSEAQRGYAWDYWTSRTVPCLLALGYPVPGVPERDAFIARSYAGTSWNPYLLIARVGCAVAGDRRASARCSPTRIRPSTSHPGRR